MSVFDGLKFRKIHSPIHDLDPRVKFIYVCVIFLAAIIFFELLKRFNHDSFDIYLKRLCRGCYRKNKIAVTFFLLKSPSTPLFGISLILPRCPSERKSLGKYYKKALITDTCCSCASSLQCFPWSLTLSIFPIWFELYAL